MARRKRPDRRKKPPSERRAERDKLTAIEAKEAALADMLRHGFDPALAAGCMVAGIICEDEAGLARIAARHPEACPRWREAVDAYRKAYPDRFGPSYRSLDQVLELLGQERDAGSWSAHRSFVMIHTMRSMGLTFREIVNLRKEDVDLDSGTMRLPAAEFEEAELELRHRRDRPEQ